MAEFIHSTELSIDGPFLVERLHLESLDKILNEEAERFRQERKKLIEQMVEMEFKTERERISNRDKKDNEIRSEILAQLEKSIQFQERRETYLHLKSGSVAKVPDFATALREPDLQDKELNGFHSILESGKHRCAITLSNRNATLAVEVEPKRNQFVQESFMTLKNWQNSVRPPKWQTIWMKAASFGIAHWMIWLIACWICFVFLEQKAENTQIHPYSQVANQLINATNLSLADQSKAIQLLLAKSYGYAPQPIKRDFPNWFFVLLFGGFAYCIALSYSPKVCVDIGQGQKKIRFWRKYSTFVLITTPTFIFTTFMWPKIEPILKSIL